MIDLNSFNIIIIAEIHGYYKNKHPANLDILEKLDAIYDKYVIPYQPDIILHELVDPRKSYTYTEFRTAYEKEERISHYGATGYELNIPYKKILEAKCKVEGCDDPAEVIEVKDVSPAATMESNKRREKYMVNKLIATLKKYKKIIFNVGQDHVIYDTLLRTFVNKNPNVACVIQNGILLRKIDLGQVVKGEIALDTIKDKINKYLNTTFKTEKLKEAYNVKLLTGAEIDYDFNKEVSDHTVGLFITLVGTLPTDIKLYKEKDKYINKFKSYLKDNVKEQCRNYTNVNNLTVGDAYFVSALTLQATLNDLLRKNKFYDIEDYYILDKTYDLFSNLKIVIDTEDKLEKKDLNNVKEAYIKQGVDVNTKFTNVVGNEKKIKFTAENFNLTVEANSKNRAVVEALILDYIKKITQDEDNLNLYRHLFDSMSDAEFDMYMHKIKNDDIRLAIISPVGSPNNNKITVKNNIKIGKELGYDFFQHINFGSTATTNAYRTPNTYCVIKLPVRRASQLLSKKISIPEHNKAVDSLTGQVTNKSKGSKLSAPEVQVLLGMGLTNTITEFMKVRGGDDGASRTMNQDLVNTGVATLARSNANSTGVTSTTTLNSYFNGMHIRTTLLTKPAVR